MTAEQRTCNLAVRARPPSHLRRLAAHKDDDGGAGTASLLAWTSAMFYDMGLDALFDILRRIEEAGAAGYPSPAFSAQLTSEGARKGGGRLATSVLHQ